MEVPIEPYDPKAPNSKCRKPLAEAKATVSACGASGISGKPLHRAKGLGFRAFRDQDLRVRVYRLGLWGV